MGHETHRLPRCDGYGGLALRHLPNSQGRSPPALFAFPDPSHTIFPQVRLVWPGGLSLPKVLYYLNRYLAFFAIIFCNYRQ